MENTVFHGDDSLFHALSACITDWTTSFVFTLSTKEEVYPFPGVCFPHVIHVKNVNNMKNQDFFFLSIFMISSIEARMDASDFIISEILSFPCMTVVWSLPP